MATDLIFHESDEALVFQATERPVIINGIVSAAVAFVIVAIAAHWLPALPLPVVLVAGLLMGGAAFAVALRPRRAELRVTNLEYVSRGSDFRGVFLSLSAYRERTCGGWNTKRTRAGRKTIIRAECTPS
jgi:hypothetical protein